MQQSKAKQSKAQHSTLFPNHVWWMIYLHASCQVKYLTNPNMLLPIFSHATKLQVTLTIAFFFFACYISILPEWNAHPNIWLAIECFVFTIPTLLSPWWQKKK
jgi:hypothetical protein